MSQMLKYTLDKISVYVWHIVFAQTVSTTTLKQTIQVEDEIDIVVPTHFLWPFYLLVSIHCRVGVEPCSLA